MEAKAKDFYKSEFQGFDIVMISKRSGTYREWLDARTKRIKSPFKGIPNSPNQCTSDRKKKDYTPPNKSWWDKEKSP